MYIIQRLYVNMYTYDKDLYLHVFSPVSTTCQETASLVTQTHRPKACIPSRGSLKTRLPNTHLHCTTRGASVDDGGPTLLQGS